MASSSSTSPKPRPTMTAPLFPNQRQHLYHRLGFGEDTPIDLCQRWQIQEFARFGSILRDNFRSDTV